MKRLYRGPWSLVWEPWAYFNLSFDPSPGSPWIFRLSLGWHCWGLGIAFRVAGEGFKAAAVAVGPLGLEVKRFAFGPSADDEEDDT